MVGQSAARMGPSGPRSRQWEMQQWQASAQEESSELTPADLTEASIPVREIIIKVYVAKHSKGKKRELYLRIGQCVSLGSSVVGQG